MSDLARIYDARIGTERGDRYRYVAIAVAGLVVVWFENATISTFLARASAGGAIGLFIGLPFLAFLTRPVRIRSTTRNEYRKGLGLLHALRARDGRFFLAVIGWTLLTLVVVAAVLVGVYALGLLVWVATICNWVYVVSFGIVLLHLVPSTIHVGSARPVTIYVMGEEGAGKSTLIGLLPLDPSLPAWTVAPSPTAKAIALRLQSQIPQERASAAGAKTPQHFFTHVRPWSRYVGVRSRPVDFVEIHGGHSKGRGKRIPGFVLMLPSTALDRPSEERAALLKKEIHRVRERAKIGKDGRITNPVVLLISKADLATSPLRDGESVFTEEERLALEKRMKMFEVFVAADREASSSDSRTSFAPRGYKKSVVWLLERIG